MTGTASGRSRFLFESDTARNQEWLRRRKLRLEQVRKQSNEIAKALRQKIADVEKARLDEFEKIGQAKLRDWKTEKLQTLENQLQCALKEFGESYKLAEAEPDPKEVLEEKHKVNLEKAQKRGDIAMQEEFKKKKIQEEKKLSPILRKKLVRKKEDLRSALVHSLPLKKQLIDVQEIHEKKNQENIPEKVTSVHSKKKILNSKDTNIPASIKKLQVEKLKKKKSPLRRSCLCKHKKVSEVYHPEDNETIWINLNEIQTSSTGDSSVRGRSSKSSESTEKEQKGKPEKIIEFYDFSSRYYCKSYKEFPHSVERIEPESEMPNANILAKVESEKEKEDIKKRVTVKTISQERGLEALRREKISQDYNTLVTKLEELSRKEKILKAQQRNRSKILHMNDERLQEKLKTRQQIMNSKFESICYEALSQNPRTQSPLPEVFSCRDGGDCIEKISTRLSFSNASSCLKPNSPVTSEEKPYLESTSLEESSRKPKKTKKKRQLLLDIDKALKEGRELRKTISRNQVSLEEENKKEKEPASLETETKITETSPTEKREVHLESEEKATRTQESQTEELEVAVGEPAFKNFKLFDKTGDDSLPLSTSTSYKSPPSVIRSYRLRQFLDYLEGVSEVEVNNSTERKTKFHKKLNKFLQNLLDKSNRKSEESEVESRQTPTLEYYIEKLLNMSRECIADLSVSSENMSTPVITDCEVKESKDVEIQNLCDLFPKGENLIRKSRLERADVLQETIDIWKQILGKNTQPDAEDEHDGQCELEEIGETNEKPLCDFHHANVSSRYEEITKKCSERISELSNMLDKMREDKEKLLSSTSGGSSLSLRDNDRNTEKDFGLEDEEDVVPMQKMVSMENLKNSVLDDFINKYNVSSSMNDTASTIAVADSQSLPDCEDSVESWPDVMDELLRRKIITSPFKWSDGEHSSGLTSINGNETKPSSIETVIGNFRKEINKIKPFTALAPFATSDATHLKTQHSFDDKHVKKESFCSPRETVCCRPLTDGEKFSREESSVESINHALSSLGLNWAKSFLRKNEESRAMSSSSNSEGKSSDDEAEDYT